MIQITPQMRILLTVEPVDFRKGKTVLRGSAKAFIWTLSAGISSSSVVGAVPFKIISYDSQGYWLCQKRLSRGRFSFWPKAVEALCPLAVLELQAFLWNKDPGEVPLWRLLK
jgi:hypothetical protein